MRYPILLCLCCALAVGCAPKPSAVPAAAGIAGIQVTDLSPGNGSEISAGQTAVVNYTGWLYDAAAPDKKGKQFDSSLGSGQPFSFKLGAGAVIKGWDVGVSGMKVGGRRRLTLPPDFAYGDDGAGGVIPPGATLVFDVDLLGIQ